MITEADNYNQSVNHKTKKITFNVKGSHRSEAKDSDECLSDRSRRQSAMPNMVACAAQ